MKNSTIKGLHFYQIGFQCFLLCFPFIATAQTESDNKQEAHIMATAQQKSLKKSLFKYAYYFAGLGYDLNHRISNLNTGGSFFFQNNIGATVSLKEFIYEAEDLPADYDGGIWSSILCTAPSDNITFYSLRLSKIWGINSGSKRFGLESGFSWVKYSKTKFRPQNLCWLCTDNYDEETVTRNTIGLAFRTVITIPINRLLGLELAAFSEINQYKQVYGFEGSLLIGKVRARSSKK